MIYELRLFDRVLLRFSAVASSSDPNIRILWTDDSSKSLLPLGMELSDKGLYQWIRRRSVPKNRAYVQTFLAKCGLSINRPMQVISVSKGLSLNDSYWVTEEGFQGTFEEYNLYDHRFNRVLGLIAFTGYGTTRSTFMSSPEFTTNGMLPKCWRRIDGEIRLYKGGTSGAVNAGNEPYSEFYAHEIADILGIRSIQYGLSRWKGILCSTCTLFTDKDHSYIPVGYLVTQGGMDAVKKYYDELGPEFTEALEDMFVLDGLICNTDRHFGNFGVMVDSHTNKILRPAPLFDHGNSLFNYAAPDDLVSEKTFRKYVRSLRPCVYDDFMEEAEKSVRARHMEGLRKLAAMNHLKRNPRYNLPPERLNRIEEAVRERAQILIRNSSK